MDSSTSFLASVFFMDLLYMGAKSRVSNDFNFFFTKVNSKCFHYPPSRRQWGLKKKFENSHNLAVIQEMVGPAIHVTHDFQDNALSIGAAILQSSKFESVLYL
jgi:hypothetical protein